MLACAHTQHPQQHHTCTFMHVLSACAQAASKAGPCQVTKGCHSVGLPSQLLPPQVGIVSSATGELTDWHESVKGVHEWACTCDVALFKYVACEKEWTLLLPPLFTGWEVYKSKLDNEYPLGFPIAGNDVTYRFSFELNMMDDESNLQKHEAAVADLISKGVDFIANAQPNFAMEEAVLSNEANLINIHGVTSNTAVAIVYRGDLIELRVACKAALQAAEADGLPVQEIVYTTSDSEVLDACHTCGSNMCHDQLVMPAFSCSGILKGYKRAGTPIRLVVWVGRPQLISQLQEKQWKQGGRTSRAGVLGEACMRMLHSSVQI
eukprot:1162145-Pelagomonas_calceolata.AAC.1